MIAFNFKDSSQPVITRDNAGYGDNYTYWLDSKAIACVVNGSYVFVKQDFYRMNAANLKDLVRFFRDYVPSFLADIDIDTVTGEEIRNICRNDARIQLVARVAA